MKSRCACDIGKVKKLRFLKCVAVLMVIALFVALLLVGYLFSTANVSIVAFKAEGVQTAGDRERFDEIKESILNETFRGTLFQLAPPGDEIGRAHV